MAKLNFVNKIQKTFSHEMWHILVVDDEQMIHSITELALKPFSFQNRKVQIHSAYSAKEALLMLQEHNNISIILLDVVMETLNAGLDAVESIRDMTDAKVRILIRTGQSGSHIESDVIKQYEINGLYNKAQLDGVKLQNVILLALRDYVTMTEIGAKK